VPIDSKSPGFGRDLKEIGQKCDRVAAIEEIGRHCRDIALTALPCSVRLRPFKIRNYYLNRLITKVAQNG